jgi:hypothetical protein
MRLRAAIFDTCFENKSARRLSGVERARTRLAVEARYIPPRRWRDKTPRRWQDRPAIRYLTLTTLAIGVALIVVDLTYRQACLF